MPERRATVARETKETKVRLELDVDGTGRYQEIQSPYQPGCLETTIATAMQGITAVLAD